MNKRLLLLLVLLSTIVGVETAHAQASYNFKYTQGVNVDDYCDQEVFLYNILTGNLQVVNKHLI